MTDNLRSVSDWAQSQRVLGRANGVTTEVVTIPPIVGVLVSDYWIACSYTRNQHQAFNIRGLIAWVCGVAVMVAMTHPLKNVLGMVIAALVYRIVVVVGRASARRSANVS